MRNVKQLIAGLKKTGNPLDPSTIRVAKVLEKIATATGSSVQERARTILHKYVPGGITDTLEPITKAGAMATAVIDKLGGCDRIAVGAGTQTSYYYHSKRVWCAQKLVRHVRLKVTALGAAPIVGFQTHGAGAPYSNATNSLVWIYCNLLTGAMTSATGANTDITDKNSFLTAVQAGEVIDVYFESFNLTHWKLTVIRENLGGEVSIRRHGWTGDYRGMTSLQFVSTILADGTFVVLEDETYVAETDKNKVVLHGDSLLSGAGITFKDSFLGKLKDKLNVPVASLAAGSMYVDGALATLPDLLKLNPEYVLYVNCLGPMFGGWLLDQAGANFIAWDVKFRRYIDTLEAAGIKPIMFIPNNSYLYTQAAVDAFIAYWKSKYPGRPYLTLEDKYVKFDNTAFHYTGMTNDIATDRLLDILSQNGAI